MLLKLLSLIPCPETWLLWRAIPYGGCRPSSGTRSAPSWNPCEAASFRLVCRTFNDIGVRFVLRDLTIYLGSDDFDRLRAIAGDPAKSKCIRSLVYSPGAFYPVGQPDIKAVNLVLRCSRLLTLAKLQAHDTYRTACRNQARILSHDLDYELLAAVLPQLSGLRKFLIDCEVERPEHRTRKGSNLMRWAWCQSTQHPHTQHGKPGRRALASLLRALDTSGTALPTLKALGLDWASVEDLSWATTRPRLTSFFVSLRHLNLQFCLCGILRPPHGPPYQHSDPHADAYRYTQLLASPSSGGGALARFLAALPDLCALAISFCYGLRANTAPTSHVVLPSLEHVIRQGREQQPPRCWPRLASLSLGGLNLEKELLMGFLESHKTKLRRMELFSVWLDADCPETLREMRRVLALEEAAVWTRIYSDRGQWHLGRPRVDATNADGKGEGYVSGEHGVNLATAVARYLVHGGECPVTESDMVPGGASLVEGCYTRSLY
ncbi:hypothetical protein VTI74DRAFT_9474 [Chaetomium olivicolor]